MSAKIILIVEDESTIQEQVVRWLISFEQTIFRAEHMVQAREILRDHWDEIELIIMDVMLPKDEKDAQKVKCLIETREEAYTKWLSLEDKRPSNGDLEWRKARFAVDALDREIFDLLDTEGGINLILEHVQEEKKFQKPVLYLSARENQSIRDKGLTLIAKGKSDWLVKPITEGEVTLAVKRLLAKGKGE
jgi:DNA-binding response OmpR family regulator